MKNKKLCFDIFTALIILIITATLIFFISISFVPKDPYISTFNSNAKLVFTNTSVILTNADTKGYTVPDGIYCGSLITESRSGKYEDISKTVEKYADTDQLIDICLKNLMGTDNAGAGYYCVVINNTTPVCAFWSRTDTVAAYSRELGTSAVKGTDVKGTINGSRFGSYPKENYGSDKIKFNFSESELSELPLYSSCGSKNTVSVHRILDSSYFDPLLFLSVLTLFPYCLILPAEIIILAARIYFVRKKRTAQ